MFFDIDPDNGIPIYDQVMRQIKFAIAQGVLRPGDRIPSVRDLAKELVINPNTIARSYQGLQAEGILAANRGIGLEVAKGARAECQRQRKTLVHERLMQVILEARQSGLDEESIERLYRQCLAETSTRSVSQ